mmetsp:Transcript_31595/g.98280  ORF Transcript_31595/g.98280 Transcript_31595/m.98280 type:complete len:374 (+) Transcript_31595:675-1796(+)
MTHPRRMHVREATGNLSAEALDDGEGHDGLPRACEDANSKGVQVEVTNVVHSQDNAFTGVQGLECTNGIGVRRQVLEDADLRVEGEQLGRSCHGLLVDDLQSSRAVLRVVRLEHAAKRPGTQPLPQGVIAQGAGVVKLLIQCRILDGNAVQAISRKLPKVELADCLHGTIQLALETLHLSREDPGRLAQRGLRPHGRHPHYAGGQLLALMQKDDFIYATCEARGRQLKLPLRVIIQAQEDRNAGGPLILLDGVDAHKSGLEKSATAKDQDHLGRRPVAVVWTEDLEKCLAGIHAGKIHLAKLLAVHLRFRNNVELVLQGSKARQRVDRLSLEACSGVATVRCVCGIGRPLPLPALRSLCLAAPHKRALLSRRV